MTLIGIGRQNVTCLLYYSVKFVEKYSFLAEILFWGSRLRLESSCIRVNMVCGNYFHLSCHTRMEITSSAPVSGSFFSVRKCLVKTHFGNL